MKTFWNKLNYEQKGLAVGILVGVVVFIFSFLTERCREMFPSFLFPSEIRLPSIGSSVDRCVENIRRFLTGNVDWGYFQAVMLPFQAIFIIMYFSGAGFFVGFCVEKFKNRRKLIS